MLSRPALLFVAWSAAAVAGAAVLSLANDAQPHAGEPSVISTHGNAMATLAPSPRPLRGRQAPESGSTGLPGHDAPKSDDAELGGTLHASVHYGDGLGAADAEVTVMQYDGKIIGEQEEPPFGYRSPHVRALPLDEPLLAFASDGYATSSIPQSFRIDRVTREARLEFELRPPASLLVRVTDEEGHAIEEPVQFELSGAAGARYLPSCCGGAWRFEGLPAGQWTLRAWTARRRVSSTVVDLASGEAAETEVRLDLGAVIEGFVVDADGRPVARAQVRAHAAKGSNEPIRGTSRTAMTGDRGEFVLTGLESGEVRLTAEVAGLDTDPWICTPELVPVTAPARNVRLTVHGTTSFGVVLERPDGERYEGRVDLSIGCADRTYIRYLMDKPRLNSGPLPRACQGLLEVCDLPGDCETPVVLNVPGYLPTVLRVPPRPGGMVDLGVIRLVEDVPLEGTTRASPSRR